MRDKPTTSKATVPPPDAIDCERVLGGLKRFQRRSVDYVFERLYGGDSTRRFLLADEVGLGKTLVARGVIAKAIERLSDSDKSRIDIVYICSNADIARQNISRLNFTGKADFQFASRITLLPQQVQELSRNRLNFISFTPETSFQMGNRIGRADERLLLYWLLRWTWPDIAGGAGAKNLLQGGVARKEDFRERLQRIEAEATVDRDLAISFSKQLLMEDTRARGAGKPTYEDRFRDLCRRFNWSRTSIPRDDAELRNAFVGEMRSILAAVCVRALEPDLIILDEFQRFKDLLRDDNAAGELARHLFTWDEARVLLLSATPYKMYTLDAEGETEDHYRDFVETLRFLQVDVPRTEQTKEFLAAYGRACMRVSQDGLGPIREAKANVERELRRVMCRTEKLAVTADRSGMLREVPMSQVQVGPQHLKTYLAVRAVAEALGHGDVTEYWKASPYLLNFMEADNYQLKDLLRQATTQGGTTALTRALKGADCALLDQEAWLAYREVAMRHPVLEQLLRQTVDTEWWRLFWMPPSLPYYQLGDPFSAAAQRGITKRLIFSSWNVVPRAISVLLSYEAERRMFLSFDSSAANTVDARERRRPLLMFARSEGRLAGMPVLSLLYPSPALAEFGDPLRGMSSASSFRSLEELVGSVSARIEDALRPITKDASTVGPEDEAWYWAAPILLDRALDRETCEAWFADPAKLADMWSPEPEERVGWREHVVQASEVAKGKLRPEGRVPRDLAKLLALFAIASPASCTLRAFGRTLHVPYSDGQLRHAAGRAGWGLRSLFNTPEVIAVLRGTSNTEPYWRRVLEYCAAGCLQSVVDEYVHVLMESDALADRTPSDAAQALAERILASAGLRAATPGVDWVSAETGISIQNQRARARFAMRYGDERGGERQEAVLRKESVRAAFNSPFWPFILATTSIGQEGLDFHTYCHAVMHWNLPSNPVDMEQREGRVHRYKGHAVRKNVASQFSDATQTLREDQNPWTDVFSWAEHQASGDSEIAPYWVFPKADGAFIERHAVALPLSREAAKLPALRASLAVYRMVFGQPRQEDLVEHLRRTVSSTELAGLSTEINISLEPIG